MTPEIQILDTALKIITKALDDLIGECTDENGQPKPPDKKTLMKAKALLPSGCKNTLVKK